MSLGQFLGVTGRSRRNSSKKLRAGRPPERQGRSGPACSRGGGGDRESPTRSWPRSWPPWGPDSTWTSTRYGPAGTGRAAVGGTLGPTEGQGHALAHDSVELVDENGTPRVTDDLKLNQGERTRVSFTEGKQVDRRAGVQRAVGRRVHQPGERNYDLFSRLLRERIIFLGTRSTTRWPTWSALSCCSSNRRRRRRTSTSTSTRPAGTSRRCSPSTTP